MPRISPAVLALSLIAAMAATPAAANPRAFVASTGSDANTASSCPQANPCRTFAAAHSVVDNGGIILALDSAGYGIVTITKSVTITANPGFYAGMGNSTGSVVTIAGTSIVVTLRGLNIDSTGAAYGINMTNGAKLSIENCVISNFSMGGGSGVYVNTPAQVRIVDTLIRDNYIGVYLKGGSTTDISGTRILGNSSSGLLVYGFTAGITSASVSDSYFGGNSIGVYAYETTASALSRIIVTRSTISHGTTGLRSEFAGGPTVITLSDSLVNGNSTGFFVGAAGSTLESFGNNSAPNNGPDGGVGAVATVALR